MAVPSSGVLTMVGIAQERLYGTYGSGVITGPIVMTDLINGGSIGGSGNSYPSLNTSSPSKPNTSTPHAMNEWYSYDQDYAAYTAFYGTTTTSKFLSSVCGISTTESYWHDGSFAMPVVGDSIYTNSSGTTAAAWSRYKGAGTSYNSNSGFGLQVSSGVVTISTLCGIP